MGKAIRDDDGEFVRAGDRIRFSFGIPPVRVIAEIIDRDGELIALTPDHKPKECRLRSLRRFVGGFWKEVGHPQYITEKMLRSGFVPTPERKGQEDE